MEHVIDVEHLKKKYGSVIAVNDVSFNVTEGEIFGLLGPNGAGKTTTVECLQGLRNPDSGNIRLLGHRSGCRCGRSAFSETEHISSKPCSQECTRNTSETGG